MPAAVLDRGGPGKEVDAQAGKTGRKMTKSWVGINDESERTDQEGWATYMLEQMGGWLCS